ncbi:sarcosine oxidase subunit alpha family protein [Algirhabdus cladophorae]|uniref:sarcosine oxidase subunit alpha family protein n=1 Tax=Algirhabdus cladophorae TaxID=3377108 RepID=UPI003B848DAE
MRLDAMGQVDRSAPLSFTFDGRRYTGFAGDTLASALLANDVLLVGRSFKYHRPRGIMTAGSEEPNALVTVGIGDKAMPNLRATTVPLVDGLVAVSQNRWPSLAFDILSLNNLVAPFLGAGFYYKTFMWPKAFWERLYEPFIRKAAGLGALPDAPDQTPSEKAYGFCDVLVVGAGPAGLMAATVAASAGLDVIVADEDTAMGGRLIREKEQIDGQPASQWVAQVLADLAQMPNVRLMPRTAITGAYDQGTFGALEQPVSGPQCFWRIAAQRCILAAGAIERPIAFAGNDRPGVMMASAVRAYLHRWGVATGKKVVVFGNTGDVERTAQDLRDAGVEAIVVDARKGEQVEATHGRLSLSHVSYTAQGKSHKVPADCLAVTGGWNPTIHLTCHKGGRPVWDGTLNCFLADPEANPDMVVCGAAAGVFDTAGCLQSGQKAGRNVAKALGKMPTDASRQQADAQAYDITPMWEVPAKGRAWLDFQNDVTTKDIRQAARENMTSVEHMKRYTTQGMATDQGKNSNVGALAILADATGRGIAQTGTTTFRPPFVPVPISALGAGGADKGLAPERFLTSHAASLERKAPMIEAGLWYRPSYFPQKGEDHWRQSCDREVGYVRDAVGVCDVSTLGKIDIQGPDAAQLLDFVYTNTFSSLKIGRVCYGLMLREDGHVMDDGTCARLGETHYLMTTTTAAAGLVMRHLEFVTQVLKPDWDVRFASVTEHWAQFAVAGPKAQDVINAVLDSTADADGLGFMGCCAARIAGVPARIFRISFSGEKGYEVAVPARYGDSLFRTLVSLAEVEGGGPYGMEALNVLRIEKGFITHAEIHGRTTAFDIGMQALVSKKKDCIGKVMSQREGLMDPARERLVGLKPIGAVQQLVAGAHLFDPNDAAISANDKGYLTSVCFSPTLGHSIGQGFLQNGPERIGRQVKMVDHLRGIEALCEVCDPVFYDPDGGRLRD